MDYIRAAMSQSYNMEEEPQMGVMEITGQSLYSGVQRGKKEEWIYLTAADLILNQDYFSDLTAHYLIQADTIYFAGSLTLPGRNLTLNARVISSDGDLSISTSGTPVPKEKDFVRQPKANSGDMAVRSGDNGGNGDDGFDGGDGMSGGHIVLVAERFDLQGQLKLSANGSNGGRGQDGGDGMNGRDGENGRDAETHWFSSDDSSEPGKDGGNGGKAGNAGRSGNGGNAGHIFVGYVTGCAEQKITMESQPGVAGAPTRPGKFGAGAKGGIGGRKFKVVTGRTTAVKIVSQEREPSGSNGKDGDPGIYAANAVDGLPANTGVFQLQYGQFYGMKEDRTEIYTDFSTLDLESSLSASLERQMLTLNKAGLAYLTGSEEKLEESAILLNWLQETTPDDSWFDAVRALDSYSSFQKSVLDTSIQWLSLRNKAIILLSQLGQGLDYFGHPWNWVPLMPLDKYQDLGSNLINAAQQAETLYLDYIKADNDQRGRVKILKDAIAVAENRINDLEDQRQKSIVDGERLVSEAGELYESILSNEKNLQNVAEEFVEELRSKLAMDSLKATFDLVVNGVALVTNVTPALTALKTGGAIASAVSNYWNTGKTIVIDDTFKSDKTVAKEKKEKEEELSKSLKNVSTVFSSGLGVLKSGAELVDLLGQIEEARDSFGYSSSMLTMSREQFDDMLKPVYGKMPEDKVDGYRKAFNQYLNVVEGYQNKTQSIKAKHLEEARLFAEMEQRRADEDRIKQAIGDDLDASLPLFHTYILDLYNGLKLSLTDFLYQEYQAYRYLVLSKDLFPLIRDSHVAELSRIHAEITVKLKDALNASENPVQPFKNVTIIFNEESFPEQFGALREHKPAFFPLSIDNQLIREKIAGKAHMMVSDCHVQLPGARHTTGSIHTEYTHYGHSTFLNLYGERFDFVHNKSHGFYEYEVTPEEGKGITGESAEKIINQSGGAVGDGNTRIMPGLLSLWSIEVPLEDRSGCKLNEGVNLSDVKKIVMTLAGKAEAYAPKTPSGKLSAFAVPKPMNSNDIFADNEMFSLPGNEPDTVTVEEKLPDSIVIEL